LPLGPNLSMIVIFVSLFLVLLGLLLVYWRFLRYRKEARERHLKARDEARKEGLEVPSWVAEHVTDDKGGREG
jgi:hypothetical protein